MITLHHGLQPALRQILEQSYDTLFDLEYDDYIELLQRHDRRQQRPTVQRQNQLRQTQTYQTNQTSQNQTSQNQTSQNQTNQTRQTRPDLMDLDPIHVQTARVKLARPTSPALDVQKNPAKLLKDKVNAATPDTSEDREYRRARRSLLGQCYCCGSTDHWISDCPISRTRSCSPSTSNRQPTPYDPYPSDDDP
jgi:hypothetical protein